MSVTGIVPGVEMVFDRDGERAFEAARDELLRSFEAWSLRGESDPGDVGVLLDWKYRYADGDLGSWTTNDLDEFLLSWMPAKVMMAPADARPFVASLRPFFPFLATERLLSGRSSSLRALDSTLVRLAPRLADALDDRSRFGPGKSIMDRFADMGIDLSDPASVQAVIDRFNSLPDPERFDMLGLRGPDEDDWDDDGPENAGWLRLTSDVPMPPALDAASPAVRAEVDGHALTDDMDTIRAFLGEGRKVTKKGNLTVADAKALATRLEVDRRALSDEFSIPRFVVRSADDLRELQFRLRLARTAGAVRLAKGVLTATATWRKLTRREAVQRVVNALLESGPLSLATSERAWVNHDVHDELEDGLPHLLAFLWAAAGERVPYDELAAGVAEVCLAATTWHPQVGVNGGKQVVEGSFSHLVDVLQEAGLLIRRDAVSVPDVGRTTRRTGGDLVLTALGRSVLGDHLAANGYDIPQVGGLTHEPLAALVEAADDWHADRTLAEYGAWVAARGPEDAIAQLVALATTRDPYQRLNLLQLADALEPPHDETAMRRLLATSLRGHATLWLLEHGNTDVDIDHDAMLRSGIDLFACQLDDPEAFDTMLADVDDIASFIDDIWRVPDPAAGDVLAAIGERHPDKTIAKHARKALIKHRSHLANQRH